MGFNGFYLDDLMIHMNLGLQCWLATEWNLVIQCHCSGIGVLAYKIPYKCAVMNDFAID